MGLMWRPKGLFINFVFTKGLGVNCHSLPSYIFSWPKGSKGLSRWGYSHLLLFGALFSSPLLGGVLPNIYSVWAFGLHAKFCLFAGLKKCSFTTRSTKIVLFLFYLSISIFILHFMSTNIVHKSYFLPLAQVIEGVFTLEFLSLPKINYHFPKRSGLRSTTNRVVSLWPSVFVIIGFQDYQDYWVSVPLLIISFGILWSWGLECHIWYKASGPSAPKKLLVIRTHQRVLGHYYYWPLDSS